MNDWFIWNNTKCTEYGIHVTELPPITLPEERTTFVEIPGRSGSLTTVEGDAVYDDITLTATCYVENTIRINEIGAWLRGSGEVTFANRQGGFYYARIVNQIPFEKILRGNSGCTFAVNFRCKPFFQMNASAIVLNAAGTVTNPTSFYSCPYIEIKGSGTDQALYVGDNIVAISTLSGSITLDCEGMIAYADELNMSSLVTIPEEWPVLQPGSNSIRWTSGITSVTITPNWRTL